MQKNSTVEHSGIVERLEGNKVRVGFVSEAACSGCHARGACSLSEVENKFVEVYDDERQWSPGERVGIILEQRAGYKALWYGYLLPLIVMLAALLTAWTITGRDGIAGLAALGILVPYYFGLYFYRKSLQKKFEFRLKKYNH